MIETTILIASVVGITEVLKRALGLNRRFIPLLSLALALLLVFIFGKGLDTAALIQTGIIAGLTASGLWSSSKALILRLLFVLFVSFPFF